MQYYSLLTSAMECKQTFLWNRQHLKELPLGWKGSWAPQVHLSRSRRSLAKTSRRRCWRTDGRVHSARPIATVNRTTAAISGAGGTGRTKRPGARGGSTARCATCNATVRRCWRHTSAGARRHRGALERLQTDRPCSRASYWLGSGSICHFEGHYIRWWTKLLLLHCWSA